MKMNSAIIATVLVIAGAGLFVGALASKGFNLTRLSGSEYKTVTADITDSFKSVDINVATADVVIEKSKDGLCKVEFYESQKITHTAKVENGTLAVTVSDGTGWYDHIGINVGSPKITLYLPEASYSSLTVNITTGDVEINGGCAYEVNIEITTGDVHITDFVCGKLKSDGSTGDLIIKNTTVSGSFEAERTTGDIMLDGFDAGRLSVKTTTGDITGTLLTERALNVNTTTGDIDVPLRSPDSENKLSATTGDIIIKFSR